MILWLANSYCVQAHVVQNDPLNTSTTSEDEITPLEQFISAASYDDVAAMQRLVAQGININAEDDGVSALKIAIMLTKDNALLYLLSLPDISTHPTALIDYIPKGKNMAVIEAFIRKGIDPNQRDQYGNMALYYAIHNLNVEAVEKLLKIDNIDMTDDEGVVNVVYDAKDNVRYYTRFSGGEQAKKAEQIFDAIVKKNLELEAKIKEAALEKN